MGKKNSVIRGIIYFNAAIVFVVLALSFYLFSFSYKAVQLDYLENNELYLDNIISRHENDVQVMSDVVTQMGLSTGITEFKLEEYPLKSVELIDRLNQFCVVSQSYGLIIYHYLDDDYAYFQRSSIGMNNIADTGFGFTGEAKEQLIAELTRENKDFEAIEEQPITGYLGGYITDLSEKGTIYCFSVIPRSRATMLFVIGDKYYDGLLLEDESEKRTNFIYLDGKVLVQRGNTSIELEALEDFIVDNKLEDTQKVIRLDGNKYLITIKTGESGLQYGTLQKYSEFTSKVIAAERGVMITLLLCFIWTLGILIFSTRFTKIKIGSLNGLVNGSEEWNVDFSNIENGIKNLIKAKNDAEEAYNKKANKYKINSDATVDENSNTARAIEYMMSHFTEPELNMAALADTLGISSANLAVEFKNDTGINPSDYLVSLRLEEAKRLLVETDYKIKEIGVMVGYEDDHVFMRRFKKYTTITPGQYRKENKPGKEIDE